MDISEFASVLAAKFKELALGPYREDPRGTSGAGGSSRFLQQLNQLQQSIYKYEDPQAQEIALQHVPMDQIYDAADKHAEEGLGYQDYIVLELLRWFKHDFFKWFNKPAEDSTLVRVEPPTPEEARYGARSVEVYSLSSGGSYRFPRYNDPVKLLDTRQGRCGEWANCFCLILRAMGVRTRYVWNAEDHVWCEVYSDSLQRWVHVDSCEEAFDNPTLYSKGWGKKMSYVLAFGVDGVADVSAKYIVEHALPRDKVGEAELQRWVRSTNIRLRKGRPEDEIFQLVLEDNRDRLWTSQHAGGKPVQARVSGSAEWKSSRGESGP